MTLQERLTSLGYHLTPERDGFTAERVRGYHFRWLLHRGESISMLTVHDIRHGQLAKYAFPSSLLSDAFDQAIAWMAQQEPLS